MNLCHKGVHGLDELAEVMGISHGSVHTLLVQGGYKKIGPKWLPHDLSAEDRRKRMAAARENLAWFERDARMLGRLISIDETWVRAYTPLDHQQSREWHLPGEDP